jgi:hypothetical protein
MMKVARLLLKRLMPLLAALTFLALPASAEPLCDPHEQHSCAAVHLELHEHDDFDEHGIHSHGNCHVPMTQSEAFELSALVDRDESVPALRDQRARSALTPALERPPRA